MTTSPSEQHLGHYIALIVSDGEEHNEEMLLFSHEILTAYNVIINLVLALGIPLHRCE